MWQDQHDTNHYPPSSTQNQYYPHTPLQFYAPPPPPADPNFYPGSRPSLDGHIGPQGAISQAAPPGYGGNIAAASGGWWTAFGTGGFEGEPPLLEGIPEISLQLSYTALNHCNAELGINFSHIGAKSMTVLNPLRRVDERIMDDADLAGPIIICFCFGVSLFLVNSPSDSVLQHLY